MKGRKEGRTDGRKEKNRIFHCPSRRCRVQLLEREGEGEKGKRAKMIR